MAKLRTLFMALVAVVLVGIGFGAGVAVDRADALPGAQATPPNGVTQTFGIFWEAWNYAQQGYVDQKALDPVKMTYGAIEGMLSSLGDVGHTRFLSPADLKAEQDALAGRLEGIGATVSVRDGAPTVVAPFPGSPAQKAGIKPGDLILKVDGQDVSGLTLDQVVNLVRGPEGSSVTLTVIHKGTSAPMDVTAVRAKITVPNVSRVRIPGSQVDQLLITQFGENATSDVIKAIQQSKAEGAKGIIVDLRNNPGGIRDEAIGVTSQFLSGGNVLLEQDAKGNRTAYPVKSGGIATDLPVVVLINEGSASSAEIMAGAIQDYKRATLIGATTFGTGTVLSPYTLSDGSAILLGTSEWLTPAGREIWHHSISPDISVALPGSATPLTPDEEIGMTQEQLQARQDTQLLRALDEINKSIQ